MNIHHTAAVERARIGIAAMLAGHTFDHDAALEAAQRITDALEADQWIPPGKPEPRPPPYRRSAVEVADPETARVAAASIRADIAAARQRRQEAEAHAEAARHGDTDAPA